MRAITTSSIRLLALVGGWGTCACGSAWAASDPDEVEDARSEADETVVVEAVPSAGVPNPSHTSAAVSVIPVDERLPASSTVASVVDSAAGVVVQRLGGLGDWSGTSIRGSTLRQVQVNLDGVPLNPSGSGAVNLSELPLWAFERVEVYRGGGPPQLGASPMGGVINLVTGDGTVGTDGSVSYGSFDTFRLLATHRQEARVGRIPVDTMWVGRAFGTQGNYRFFDDNGTLYQRLDDRIRERANNDKRQLNLHGRVRLGGQRFRVTLLESFLAREEGLAGHVYNPADNTRLGTYRSLSTVAVDGRDADWSGRGRIWLRHRVERYDDRMGEIGLGSQWNADRLTSVGALGHLAYHEGWAIAPAMTVSGRWERYGGEDLLSELPRPSGTRVAMTVAGSAEVDLWHGRLVVTPVAQVELLDSRRESVSERVVAFAPRLGVLVHPSSWLSLKANLSRGFRPPDLTELFGDRGALVGNPELVPETSLSADVGMVGHLPDGLPVAGHLGLGCSWREARDLIVFVQNAQRTMVPLNLDSARVQGLEIELSVVWDWIESQTNISGFRSIDRSAYEQFAGNQIPRLPTWQIYQRTAFTWDERLRVGHTFTFVDGNYWDRTNWYRAAPRALHGIFVRVQPGARWPSFELDVLNLVDRIAEVVPRNSLNPEDSSKVVQSITDFVGYPLPGRTVMVSIRWRG